ncbi:MAG TPA: hypothetical protein VJ828_08490 [Lacipirellulaceae bacterium]|nr:hypothetical protein [Lacipirellulaceae bacterium]
MESHEGPVYVSAPCYILAADGYTVDPKSGQVAYDEKLQFLAEGVGATDEQAVVLFTDRHLADEYLENMGEEFPLLVLEIPNNDALKRFLGLAAVVYRFASIDPNPKTGTIRAGLAIGEMLQNLDFPGISGL